MRICFLLLLFPAILSAQFQTKVSYIAALSNFATSNEILERYNAERPYLTQRWEPLRFVNGADLGLSYRAEVFRLEAGYELKFAQRQSTGIPDGTTTELTDRLFYNIQSWYVGGSVGYDFLYGGVNIMQNNYRLRYEDDSTVDRLTIMENSRFASLQIYLSLEPDTGAGFSIALRPYVELPLDELDLRPFGEFIEPDFANGVPDDFYQDRWVQYGIRVVFFNGR